MSKKLKNKKFELYYVDSDNDKIYLYEEDDF